MHRPDIDVCHPAHGKRFELGAIWVYHDASISREGHEINLRLHATSPQLLGRKSRLRASLHLFDRLGRTFAGIHVVILAKFQLASQWS